MGKSLSLVFFVFWFSDQKMLKAADGQSFLLTTKCPIKSKQVLLSKKLSSKQNKKSSWKMIFFGWAIIINLYLFQSISNYKNEKINIVTYTNYVSTVPCYINIKKYCVLLYNCIVLYCNSLLTKHCNYILINNTNRVDR